MKKYIAVIMVLLLMMGMQPSFAEDEHQPDIFIVLLNFSISELFQNLEDPELKEYAEDWLLFNFVGYTDDQSKEIYGSKLNEGEYITIERDGEGIVELQYFGTLGYPLPALSDMTDMQSMQMLVLAKFLIMGSIAFDETDGTIYDKLAQFTEDLMTNPHAVLVTDTMRLEYSQANDGTSYSIYTFSRP